jgi:hypothetical protein
MKRAIVGLALLLAWPTATAAQRLARVTPDELPEKAIQYALRCDDPPISREPSLPRTGLSPQAGRTPGGVFVVPVICIVPGGQPALQIVVVSEPGAEVLLDHAANSWMADRVLAVRLADVNQDGYADLFVAATAISGIGTDGAIPFDVVDFWLGTSDGRFQADETGRTVLRWRRLPLSRAIALVARAYR